MVVGRCGSIIIVQNQLHRKWLKVGKQLHGKLYQSRLVIQLWASATECAYTRRLSVTARPVKCGQRVIDLSDEPDCLQQKGCGRFAGHVMTTPRGRDHPLAAIFGILPSILPPPTLRLAYNQQSTRIQPLGLPQYAVRRGVRVVRRRGSGHWRRDVLPPPRQQFLDFWRCGRWRIHLFIYFPNNSQP